MLCHAQVNGGIDQHCMPSKLMTQFNGNKEPHMLEVEVNVEANQPICSSISVCPLNGKGTSNWQNINFITQSLLSHLLATR